MLHSAFYHCQTLQHLVWILGLKPVTGGGLSSSGVTGSSSTSAGVGPPSSAVGSVSQPPSENNSVITTAVMADLPVLSNMVTRLFESSGTYNVNNAYFNFYTAVDAIRCLQATYARDPSTI